MSNPQETLATLLDSVNVLAQATAQIATAYRQIADAQVPDVTVTTTSTTTAPEVAKPTPKPKPKRRTKAQVAADKKAAKAEAEAEAEAAADAAIEGAEADEDNEPDPEVTRDQVITAAKAFFKKNGPDALLKINKKYGLKILGEDITPEIFDDIYTDLTKA